jgi:hypothetical protein
MNKQATREIGDFLVFCLEEYKASVGLSGRDVYELFEKSGVLGYLQDGFDQLHTLGSAALVEDIRDYLHRRESPNPSSGGSSSARPSSGR